MPWLESFRELGLHAYHRCRRNVPYAVVDFVDSLHRLLWGRRRLYPYTAGQSSYEPFFIVGSGRSGNTLLRRLLQERAEVVIPPEIPGLGPTIRRFTQVAGASWAVIVDCVLGRFQELAALRVATRDVAGKPTTYCLADELGLDFDDISARLKGLGEADRSLAAIIAQIYEAYSLRTTGEVLAWGDKTPWTVFHYGGLKKVFPNARYVHMLRDGRDCVVSYVDSLGQLLRLNHASAAHRWVDAVRHVRRIAKENVNRFIVVRYEEIVENPDEILDTVIAFLGLVRRDARRGGVAVKGDGHMWHHRNLARPVTSRSVGRWRTELPSAARPLASG